MLTIDDGLLRYLAVRGRQREREIEDAYPDLEAAITAFLPAHRDDPGVPVLLARMMREMAVAAFVRGTMHAAGVPYSQIQQPRGAVMLHAALETIRSMEDLYPAFALFDGRRSDPDVDDDGREWS